MAALRTVLLVGLADIPAHEASSVEPWFTTNKLLRAIDAQVAEGDKAWFPITPFLFKHDEFAQKMLAVRAKLEEIKPDLFVIGNGVRRRAEFTECFENIVNSCREVTPRTRLGFNSRSDDLLECCQRNSR